MTHPHFIHGGNPTYICQGCHKETRDTGRGEAGTGLCWKCYQINEQDNEHCDDHPGDFSTCPICRQALEKLGLLKHLPYYLGEKSYPTI
jgi:hypothetical protein